MALQASDIKEMHRQMVETRHYDLLTNKWHQEGLIQEAVHESTGQEAIAIGSCYGLRTTDQVMPSLRTRGAFFAKGVPTLTALRAMRACKSSPSMGHETSHHTGYPEYGVLVGTGMVGSSISIGTGAALAMQLQGKDGVVLNYFGDGATNRGDFHESINLAAVWNLPVIFYIENNGIALTLESARNHRCEKLSDRALGYGIPGYTIDGNDIFEVYDYSQKAIARARKGEGPTLIECLTTRLRPHIGLRPDVRPPEEVEKLWDKCPIKRLEAYMVEKKIATKEELEAVHVKEQERLKKEVDMIQSEPRVTREDLYLHVYEEGSAR